MESTGNFAYLEIGAFPCNQKLTHPTLGGKEYHISDECVWDLDAQINYFKPPNLITFYNQERLNLEKFGEASIERYATVKQIQYDETKPSWIQGYFHRNTLSDETSYVNYG